MNRNQNRYQNKYSSRAESVSNWRDKKAVNEEMNNNDNNQKRHYSTFNKNKNFDKNFERNEGGQQRRNYNSFNRNRNDDGQRQNNYNSFNKNRNYDRNNRYNRNNRNNYNYVDYYEPEKKEVQREYNILDYPELAYNQADNEKIAVPDYLEMCKKTNQEDEERKPIVNVNDPKYWDRYRYIGPKLIKSEKQSPQFQHYLREASKNASSIIIPYKQILYSRDGLNWHLSWKETFTDLEWNNMNTQIEQDSLARVFNKMSIRYENELEDAYDLYDETGEVNGCLQCHLDSIEHDKYLEKLDKQFEDISLSGESDNDSETEYYSN